MTAYRLILFPALAFALFCAACLRQEEEAIPTCIIGVSYVCEERFEFFNYALAENINLALSLHSDGGIIQREHGPVRIQLLAMPVVNKEDMPHRVLHETAKNYGITAAIGNLCSMTATQMAETAESLQLPYLVPITAAPVNRGKDYTFVTSPSMQKRAQAYGFFLRDTLKATRIAVLNQKNALSGVVFAESLRDFFSRTADSRVDFAEFENREEMPGKLAELLAGKPEAIIFCPVAPHIFTVAGELEKLGYSGPLLGAQSGHLLDYKNRLPLPGLPIHSVSYWNPLDTHTPTLHQYAQAFKNLTNRDPGEYDVYIYDTVLRLLEAIRANDDLSPARLRRELAARRSLDGVGGHYSYLPDAQISPVWSISLLDGKLQTDEIDLPAALQ